MESAKVAIITGSATGIGRACALALAKQGFCLMLNYRSKKSEVQSLQPNLPGKGHRIFEGDIAVPEIVSDLVAKTVQEFGRIDVLVNAAGVFEEHDITALSYDSWQKAWAYNLNVNLVAAMNLAFCAAQYMIKRRSGKIINITSRGAFRGEPDAPAYGASKAGLNSASQSLAKALAPYGVSVFAIAPGWVRTPLASPYLEGSAGESIKAQSPLGRVGEPDEIANLVSFLAGEKTEYLTGSIIDANGASYLRN